MKMVEATQPESRSEGLEACSLSGALLAGQF